MLIPYYHFVPAYYPVAANQTINQGQIVALNASGQIVLTTGNNQPLGLAGDKVGTLTAGKFTNRVSDYGDDTDASGQMTVYHSGGEFYVDLEECFETGISSVTPGAFLVASDSEDGMFDIAPNDAALHSQTAGKQLVARVVDDLASTLGALPTGIPGEYEPSGDHEDIEINGAYNYPGGGGTPRVFCRIQLLI